MGGVYFCFDIKDEFLVEEKKMCGILFKKEVVLKFMKTNITSTRECTGHCTNKHATLPSHEVYEVSV